MNVSRRTLLLGAPMALLVSRRLHAQLAVDREHRPVIDTPTLAEDPSAVPLQVSVNHPMEPEHFIRSIEIRLDHDPVPYKGKFLFTPANGLAAVAFHMRSGAGGVVAATRGSVCRRRSGSATLCRSARRSITTRTTA